MDVADEVDCVHLTRWLLQLGADASERTSGGLDVFLTAALRGHWETLDVLLHLALPSPSRDHWFASEGPWTTNITKDILAYLMDALQQHDLVEARREAQFDQTTLSRTLLWMGVALDNERMVKGLLECGADPKWVDEDGWGPIHLACFKGSEATVRQLLLSGADLAAKTCNGPSYYQSLQIPDNWQGTALHLASAKDSPSVVQLLISHGADVRSLVQGDFSAPGSGPTALHIALGTRRFHGMREPSLGQEKLRIAEMLVESGADVANVANHICLEDLVEFEGHEELWDMLRKGISEKGVCVPAYDGGSMF